MREEKKRRSWEWSLPLLS